MAICRYCKKQINEGKKEEFIQRSQGYFYHSECWKTFTDPTRKKSDEEWLDLLFKLITHDIHGSYNYHQVKRQFENMLADGLTAKGIYFTFYWHHLIKKQEWQSKFGIGLIPHLYQDSIRYWSQIELRRRGILEQIARKESEDFSALKPVAIPRREVPKRQISAPTLE